LSAPITAGNDLPAALRREAESQLTPGEAILAWFEPDLDQKLFYAKGLVIFTGKRLLTLADPRPADGSDGRWQSLSLDGEVTLKAGEHGSVGALELIGPAGRLAHWRYTAGRAGDAHRLVLRLTALRASPDNGAAGSTVCPSCGAVVQEDGQCPACAQTQVRPSMSALMRLIPFARPVAGLAVLGFVLTLASTGAGLVPPYVAKLLIDDVLLPNQAGQPEASFSPVPWYIAVMLLAALATWLLDWGRLYTTSLVSEQISAELRSKTYGHLQRLSLEFFGGKRTGDLMARISNDTERLCNFLSLNLVDFGTDLIMLAMTAGILLTLNWQLALAALCPFPIIVWLVSRVRSRLLRGYRQAGVAWGTMTSVLADTIPGIRVVKAFAQEQREIERFDVSNDRVFHVNNRLNRVWAVFGPTITFLTTCGLLVVWAFGSWKAFQPNSIQVGTLTAFLLYIQRFYTRIESMIRMVSATQRAAASAQRIFEILDRTPSVPEPARPVHPGRLAGRIALRGVRFKYGSREVLHGLDLKIEPGEMIGLVGPSGAGKSTLINLICRFYDVAAGAILVDGTDVRSFPVEEYRRNIGIVLQDPFLFYGTIAENIAYGTPNASRAEIVAAARLAFGVP
jgi:ATP-binding cassette subfamily B protein